MIDYKFLTTKKLSKALEYLGEKENIKILAGGTDLLVDINKESKRLGKFDYLLDITNIPELKYIDKKDKYIEIGSLVTHSMLIDNKLIKDYFPFLVEAARTIGSTQIRNRGTIGGNINNASPAADLLPGLIALKSEVVLKSKNNERVLPLSRFLTGPYKTDRKKDEIMTSVRIPLPPENLYGNFQKIGRRKALNIARLNLALVTIIENKTFIDISVVPGAATPYPQPFHGIKKAIKGKRIQEIDPEEIGNRAAEEMVSITGERWSTPYKRPAISTLVKRALNAVIEEATGNE